MNIRKSLAGDVVSTSSFVTLTSLLAAVFLVCSLITLPSGAFANDDSDQNADTYQHEIVLEPGSSTDVKKAGQSTLYIINAPGSYTLSGKTEKAHVVVKTGDVKLYVDGLTMTPGFYALPRAGVDCPAIEIEDFSGTVELISKAGTTSTFSSYRHAAPIQKDGLKTKLVFKTEDETNPGTINSNVTTDFYSRAAGIGAPYRGLIRVDCSVGNMVFESGIVNAEGGLDAAGIGGADSTLKVRDITIKGTAIVTATGNGCGAGIGSGYSCADLNGIRIEGGTVVAKSTGTGNTGGAGIGYGGWDNFDTRYGTITITGGNITATGGACGAGIGGAAKTCPDKILITGGTIKATGGKLACGIGSGGFPGVNEADDELDAALGMADRAADTLGDVSTIASTDIPSNADVWSCRSIEITGGDITATGGGGYGCVGIGNSNRSYGTQSISIKGGIIRAYSGENKGSNYGYAIGGGAKVSLITATSVSLDISGGTIYAKSQSTKGSAFGVFENAFASASKIFKVTITGGSILSDPDSNVGTFQVEPVNAEGEEVAPVTVNLAGLTGNRVTPNRMDLTGATTRFFGASDNYNMSNTLALSFDDISASALNLGSDLGSNSDSEQVVFYPWVTKDAALLWINIPTSSGSVFYSSDFTDWFYPRTNITLDGSNQAGTNGASTADYGFSAETTSEPVAPGYKVSYYTLGASPSSTLIMDAGGKLVKNATIDGQIATDDQGRWMYEGGLSGALEPRALTLYAQFEPINYTIAYDVNKPASATSEVSGSLPPSVSAQGGNAYILGEGGSLTLPGYKLVGWNTKPDGSGTGYEDGETAANLTSEDGSTVTLYAQWERLTYQISFDKGEGATGSMSTITATIDVAAELPLCTFDREGYLFVGWQAGASVGSLFDDGATVINQCAKDSDGNFVLDNAGNPIGLTLKAVWAKETDLNADACVVVTKDGSPVAGLAQANNPRLVIKSIDTAGSGGVSGNEGTDGTEFAPFEEAMISGNVAYVIKNSAPSLLPQGTYSIWLDGVDTGQILVIDGRSEMCHVACSTVKVAFDQNITTVQRELLNKKKVLADTADNVFVNGTQLSYTAVLANPQSGYTFGNWDVCGVAPEFINSTSQTSNPVKIEVKGAVTLIAQTALTEYFISFDANGAPDGSDISGTMLDQKCFCHLKSSLSVNAYMRTGYTFDGWNTKADGSGTSYANEAEVENLTMVEETITLYAQWKPITYTIYFDGNFGEGSMDAMQLAYGQEYNLAKCSYIKENAKFIGWNTERDGSGTAYADEAAVENLFSEQGAYLVLYAQWEDVSPAPAPDPDPDPDPSPDPDPDPDPSPVPDPTPVPEPDNPSGSDSGSSDSGASHSGANNSSRIAATGDSTARAGFVVAGFAGAVALISAVITIAARRRRFNSKL